MHDPKMKWTKARYTVGSGLNRVMHAVLSYPNLPLSRLIPHGLSGFYDIQRYVGARDIGVIFDVGANTGQTAWGLTRYFKHSTIYCFEPVRDTYERLLKSYGGKVNCVLAGLGAEAGEREIQLFSDSALNSFCEVRGSAVGLGIERVTVETVDRFCEAKSIQEIGLLKLDVQGWEMEVLAGARAMLGRNAVRFILAEVGFHKRDRDMQQFSALNEFLDGLGFELCGFYDLFRWGRSKSFLGFANALYVRPATEPDTVVSAASIPSAAAASP